MNKLINNIVIPSLLLVGLILSPLALAQSPFDGHDITVKFERWEVDDDKKITSVLSVINELDISASDSNSPDDEDFQPDAENFHALDENFHLWSIDFYKREVELIFTSIEEGGNNNQYKYGTPLGFHFVDTDENLSDILHVTIDDRFAPTSYNKDLASFDANNIYISLQKSECRVGFKPDCENDDSPTGYNNIIKLDVLLAETADALFDWAEEVASDIFPGHEESFYLFGFYVREYPDYFVGTKDGIIYLYEKEPGNLSDLGKIGPWLDLVDTNE